MNDCRRMWNKIRLKIYIDTSVFIPVDTRCCYKHFDMKLKCSTIDVKENFGDSVVEGKMISYLLDELRKTIKKSKASISITLLQWTMKTGLAKQQFNDIVECVYGIIKSTINRTVRTSVSMFLTKLYTDLSFCFVNKRSICRAISVTRKVLATHFVPRFLGVDHISHETVVNEHSGIMAKYFFKTRESSSFLVADGIYNGNNVLLSYG